MNASALQCKLHVTSCSVAACTARAAAAARAYCIAYNRTVRLFADGESNRVVSAIPLARRLPPRPLFWRPSLAASRRLASPDGEQLVGREVRPLTRLFASAQRHAGKADRKSVV